jgi:hypothetical protein
MRHSLRISVIAALLVVGGSSRSVAQQTSAGASDPVIAAADSLQKIGQHDAALRAYQAVASKHSQDAAYWNAVGASAGDAKQYAIGASAFEKSAAISPNPISMYNAAAMHARLGHADEAFDWLHKSIKAGFYLPNILTTDDDLASIRSDPRFPGILTEARDALTPCARDPEARRFDFWVGEWKLTGANGRPAGDSSIQLVSGQCALLENFTNVNGTTGKSLNSYNTQTKQWEEFWVGQNQAVTEYREGRWDGTSLVFLAHGMRADGKPQLMRLTFTPLSPDKVRQFAQNSDDDGKTWQRAYDIIYDRKK